MTVVTVVVKGILLVLVQRRKINERTGRNSNLPVQEAT
jgi:hypothetical protein